MLLEVAPYFSKSAMEVKAERAPSNWASLPAGPLTRSAVPLPAATTTERLRLSWLRPDARVTGSLPQLSMVPVPLRPE
ncbi:hypothetical protein D3C86_1661950 [compost metagenome]